MRGLASPILKSTRERSAVSGPSAICIYSFKQKKGRPRWCITQPQCEFFNRRDSGSKPRVCLAVVVFCFHIDAASQPFSYRHRISFCRHSLMGRRRKGASGRFRIFNRFFSGVDRRYREAGEFGVILGSFFEKSMKNNSE